MRTECIHILFNNRRLLNLMDIVHLLNTVIQVDFLFLFLHGVSACMPVPVTVTRQHFKVIAEAVNKRACSCAELLKSNMYHHCDSNP